jgi:hypothetical protein
VSVVLVVLAVLFVVLGVLAASSVRVLREYERGVVFRLGRLIDQKGPGLILLIPAIDRNDFTYPTSSEQPLTMRGAVAPTPERGFVVVRRAYERSRTYKARIGADGSFKLPTLRLRKIANNTFVVAIHAPPSAVRRVYFTALCLDCLAGGPPPGS